MLNLPPAKTLVFLELGLPGRLGARYGELVEQEQIHYDPAQVAALKVLQELSQELGAPVVDKKPSFVGRLFSAPPKTIKGVYIHGDVGRGKSMLMDLFFDDCAVAPKRRVHFHAFMIEVHAFMHDWRSENEGDPIPPLSKTIRASAQLLCFDEFHVHDIADAM
ncbi:MAG: cell division protein ZapE, partial [Methylococcales bacterium]